MRRRILLRYSPADYKQAKVFRDKWLDTINFILDENDSQPSAVAAHESDAEAGASTSDAKPSVSVLLIGAETASDTSLMARVTDGPRGDCIIGVRLAPELAVPTAIYAAGSEILDFDSDEVPRACDRAMTAIRRAPAIVDAASSETANEDECARAPTAVVEADRVPIPE